MLEMEESRENQERPLCLATFANPNLHSSSFPTFHSVSFIKPFLSSIDSH